MCSRYSVTSESGNFYAFQEVPRPEAHACVQVPREGWLGWSSRTASHPDVADLGLRIAVLSQLTGTGQGAILTFTSSCDTVHRSYPRLWSFHVTSPSIVRMASSNSKDHKAVNTGKQSPSLHWHCRNQGHTEGEEGKNRTVIMKKFQRAESTKWFGCNIQTSWAGWRQCYCLLKALPKGILVYRLTHSYCRDRVPVTTIHSYTWMLEELTNNKLKLSTVLNGVRSLASGFSIST